MDSERLGMLIDRLAAALELYARQWCDEPEDVVQEAFVKLAASGRHRSTPRPGCSGRSATGRSTPGSPDDGGVGTRPRPRPRLPPGSRPTRRLGAARWSDPESAQAALAVLPLEQREVIVAHLWGGLTFDQIAELVGFSASSTHRLYQAGLLALRERLGVPCQTNPSRPIPS